MGMLSGDGWWFGGHGGDLACFKNRLFLFDNGYIVETASNS